MIPQQVKENIQSCHLNFLIGSGASVPFFKTLGDIESRIDEIDKFAECEESARKISRTSVLKYYFDNCIYENINLLVDADSSKAVLKNYINLFDSLSEIILRRKSTLLNKQINLFTSNMDLFHEKALERLGAEYNDGFTGRIKPVYSLSNFKKSIFKTSPHYSNVSELPLFNLFKIHGSVNWTKTTDEKIEYDSTLGLLKKLRDIEFDENRLVNVIDDSGLKSATDIINEATGIGFEDVHEQFASLYGDLLIINPTKEKFQFTTLNYVYYELLRMFSNELEKENSILFVMAFSFADEHIREIILRAVNSNPTLIVYVFAYDETSESVIKGNLDFDTAKPKYNNVIFLDREKKEEDDEVVFDLQTINDKYFKALVNELSK